MSSLSAFPIATQLARAKSRHPAALFVPDAERREGLDRAGGIGLPYEAHPVNILKNESWTPEFLVAQSERKNSGDPRSERAGRQAARTVRIGRDPASTSPTRPASSCRPIQRAATRPCSGCIFQMGGIGPMFGQLGFFHKFAGSELRGQAPARALRRRIEAPARCDGDAARRAGSGSWATISPSPTSP